MNRASGTATLARPARERAAGEEAKNQRSASGPLWVMAFVLRHGVLPWTMLVVASLCAAVLAMRGAPWRGDLLWIVDWMPISHLAVAPVIAGSAAIDSARLAVGARHLEDARWWRAPSAAVTFAYAAGISGLYVLEIVVAALVTLPPAFNPRVLLAVGVQVLMLTLFAAGGSTIGRTLNPVLGSIAAALAALAGVFLLSGRTEHIAVLYAGASVVSRVGRSYNVTYLGVQAVLLTALVLACLVSRPGVLRGRWRRTGERAMVVVAIVLVFVAANVGPSSRLTYTHAAPTLCSDVSGVRVCLYPEHARLQPEVSSQLSRLFDAARTGGYGFLVPDEVREGSGGDDGWDGAVIMIDEALSGGPIALPDLLTWIVEPFSCAERNGEQISDQYWVDARSVKGTWLELVDPALASDWAFGSPYVRHVEADEAAAIMDGFRTCTYPFR